MIYGLIGKKVNNSLSKEIHASFENFSYTHFSFNQKELEQFLKHKKFNGLNITSPYKKCVIPFLDNLDEKARKANSVNTIINISGKLIGYNTDYDGFEYLLKKNNVEIKDQVVALLGNGGVTSTLVLVLKKFNAKKIYIVSRRKSENTISYDELKKIDVNVLINASIRGQEHCYYRPLVNLKKMKSLNCVIDLITRPFFTTLLQDAQDLNIKHINGLDMLIEQARVAEQLFQNKVIDRLKNDEIRQKIIANNINIVLIGMPYAGKSYLGKKLAERMHYLHFDSDDSIRKITGRAIKDVIAKQGVKTFRQYEKQVIKTIAFKNRLVISPGGGVVESKRTMNLLRHNSLLVLVKCDDDKIEFNDERPLASNIKDYTLLKNKRAKYYDKYKDIIFINSKNEESVESLMRLCYENISYKWR